ncbi:Alpha/Beta hydrolase protein [Phaeosphaeria sp. MPI-PUGE-AT-0046c]|nr:Alpha/Beta hydrolase protein [Phaeosphaeria sp. MPI-PUGE-AT-0046c]
MQTLIFFSLTLMSNVSAAYMLPNPNGEYNVTLTTGTLTDYARSVASNGTTYPRELMLSVFQPTTCVSNVYVPYMPNKTAEYQGPYLQQQFSLPIDLSPLFLGAELPTCAIGPRDCSKENNTPILLFSPGWGIPRLYYSVLASAIASQGFTVITIDHPGDANIITYPDGHVIYGAKPGIPTDEEFTNLTYARAADASFIIDQLTNATAMSHLLPHPVPTDRIAMLGHSLGGAASVLAASQDPRIRGAMDWDGSLFGSRPVAGLSTPVLYVSHANVTDPSWVAAWPDFTGPKLWLEVEGTTHQSFSDALTLIEAAGQDLAPFADFLGTIAPSKVVGILVAYTAAWMGGVFEGKLGGGVLDGEGGSRFLEVKTVRKGGF